MRILVVDDHAVLRGMLTTSLHAAGFEVVGEAADGHEAVALCSCHQVDAVVMDVRMPGMDGVTATRALLATHPDLIVIGYGSDATHRAPMLDAGAAGFVLKGAPTADLITALVSRPG